MNSIHLAQPCRRLVAGFFFKLVPRRRFAHSFVSVVKINTTLRAAGNCRINFPSITVQTCFATGVDEKQEIFEMQPVESIIVGCSRSRIPAAVRIFCWFFHISELRVAEEWSINIHGMKKLGWNRLYHEISVARYRYWYTPPLNCTSRFLWWFRKQNKHKTKHNTTISVHEFLSDSTFDYPIILLFDVRFSNNFIFLFYRYHSCTVVQQL